jgi:D-3-phosphoglycerate dehydrogenase
MKEGACLVNCARQEIVDEDDLRELKPTKKFLYCTDVYVKDAAGDKPIKDVADLMLPHLGANTAEANLNAATRAATQIIDWSKEGVKKYVVNHSVPADLDENFQKLAFYLARIGTQFLGPLQPQSVETTFYGDLQKHTKWLSPSVVLGLSPNFDPVFDAADATAFLGKMGITYTSRKIDETKHYGESITVDLISGSGENFQKVSVRGTVAEGRPIISSINGFEGLYFNPKGTTLMVEYSDRPGVLAIVTQIIAQYGINIKDVRAPQDTDTGHSLAIFLLETSEKGMPVQAVKDIKAAVGAVRALLVHL